MRFRKRFYDVLQKRHPDIAASVPKAVWRKAWVVNSKPVGSGEHALEYLARYNPSREARLDLWSLCRSMVPPSMPRLDASQIPHVRDAVSRKRARKASRGRPRHPTLIPLPGVFARPLLRKASAPSALAAC